MSSIIEIDGKPYTVDADIPDGVLTSAGEFDLYLDQHYALLEDAIREMLGRWVSEAEPALVYQKGKLVGLTVAYLPDGVVAPIVVAIDECMAGELYPPFGEGVTKYDR